MASSAISHRRTHNLLLVQKLLNLRDGASPFTLLLDTLEQSAEPVVLEFMMRAKISKTKIIFVSFQTLRKPRDADVFITGRKKTLAELRQEISSHLPEIKPVTVDALSQKVLLVIDTLHSLASTSSEHLATFLSSLLSPSTSLLAIYHTDVPITVPGPSATPPLSASTSPYAPDPLTTLLYLVTAILHISNLSHAIERKRARDRSLQEPVFGLEEALSQGREGVLVGLQGRRQEGMEGIVVEMELRRKSGRGVREIFVLVPITATGGSRETMSKMCLLDDHPLYAPPVFEDQGGMKEGDKNEDEVETTFSLGLTEKQRRDREGVVLPYFDAQRSEGVGEGGRILYDMDRGDDFDEEEDEI